MGLLDFEAAFVRLANAAAAGAFHAIEQLFFRAGQVGAIGTVILHLESGGLAIFEGKVRIGDLQMQALEIVPGKLLQGFERGFTRDSGIEIEAHIRSRPAGKRTAQNLHAELREGEAGKVSEDDARFTQLGQHGLRVLRLGDELQPLAGLEDGAVGKTVEALPVGGFDINSIKLHFLLNLVCRDGACPVSPHAKTQQAAFLR